MALAACLMKTENHPNANHVMEDKTNTKQRKYERKTKRFIWPEDLHRLFVAAIFDVGLKNASPKALIALMGNAGPIAGLTTEHLKSHLQKYRLNYERSRQEFLQYYDQSARRNLKRRRKNPKSEHNTMFVFPICHSNQQDGSDSDDEDPKLQEEDEEEEAQEEEQTPNHLNQPEERVSHSAKRQRVMTPSSQALPQPQPQPRPMLAPGYSAVVASTATPSYARPPHQPPVDNAAYRYVPAAPTMPPSHSTSSLLADMQCDPQWSILSTLMSPHITGMSQNNNQTPMMPSEQPDHFSLNEEPTHLQLQMHMAMQAQMNLHRQMLMRKVEVSQHIINNSTELTNPSRTMDGAMLYGQQPWLQHQQQQQQQQQQQHAHQNPPPPARPQSQSAPSHVTRPSLPPHVQATVADSSSSSSSLPSPLPLPTKDPTVDAPKPPNEEEALDLYRWDRLDLNMELDDDDLFGFLKS